MKCLAQPAMIFSWVRQPLRTKDGENGEGKPEGTRLRGVTLTHPPPLISVRSASTSSAPSIATSSLNGDKMRSGDTDMTVRSQTSQYSLNDQVQQRDTLNPAAPTSTSGSWSYLWVPVQVWQREAVMQDQLTSLREEEPGWKWHNHKTKQKKKKKNKHAEYLKILFIIILDQPDWESGQQLLCNDNYHRVLMLLFYYYNFSVVNLPPSQWTFNYRTFPKMNCVKTELVAEEMCPEEKELRHSKLH